MGGAVKAARAPNWRKDRHARRVMERLVEQADRLESLFDRQYREALDTIAMLLRVLRDSSEEYRRAVGVIHDIADADDIAAARNAARHFLESIK